MDVPRSAGGPAAAGSVWYSGVGGERASDRGASLRHAALFARSPLNASTNLPFQPTSSTGSPYNTMSTLSLNPPRTVDGSELQVKVTELNDARAAFILEGVDLG